MGAVLPMKSGLWRFTIGPLGTAGLAGSLWLLDRLGIPVPAPGGILLLMVIYATWAGGLIPGYISSLIFILAALPTAFEKTHFIMIVSSPSVMTGTMLAFAIGVPLLMAWLRSRVDSRLEEERRTREHIEAASRELQILHAALDHVDDGVILLDEQLRARFINRASRDLWRVPDALADRLPFIADVMRNACAAGVVSLPTAMVDAYIDRRMDQLRAGDETPLDQQLADGTTVRCRCKALAAGGRFLSYTDVTDLVRHAETLEHLATVDDLTGICNRRHFMALAQAAWERLRDGEPFSLLILDLDLFKSINDRFGHNAGDAVIRHVVDVCRSTKRGTDILARLGGEEFALLLPETRAPEAAAFAEELRRRIEAAPLALDDTVLRITVSIGIAEAERGMARISDLMKRADKALYEAKRAGRNRVRLAKSPLDGTMRATESAESATAAA
jgi:diguanylate cyclase (GGDEF)-like protein